MTVRADQDMYAEAQTFDTSPDSWIGRYVAGIDRLQADNPHLMRTYLQWATDPVDGRYWDAEHIGKWLEIATLSWRRTKSPEVRALIDETVTKLASAQLPNGYLGSYAPRLRFYEIDWQKSTGPVAPFDLWCNLTTQIGLLDVYDATGSETALKIARANMDLVIETFGKGRADLLKVMHNIPGLIELIGGNEAAAQRLEEMFADRTPVKSDSPDVTGLLGQYCQGNEPSHHIAYLFSYAGQPWRAQYWVNHLVRTFYNDTREGLCGNDDCGAMSSWLVFSALGFYPVNPASSIYIIGSPMFERAEIQTPQTGKTFTLVAKNVSKENIYIQSAKLNGELFNRPWITHDELTSGATLEFEMGSEPNKNWGVVGPIPQMAHQSPPDR